MKTTDQCKGLFGLLFGHRFEPIVTRDAPTNSIDIKGSLTGDNFVKMVNQLRKENYCGIYCTRCGTKL
jgi:hypothetical protein